MAIWKPLTAIGNGFKAIFTGPTAQGLYNITHGFASLTSRLVMGEETLGRLQRVAAGFFSVVKLALFPIVGTLKIVAAIVSKVASGFLSLGQTGAGGLLGLSAVIGDVTKKVVSFITSFDVFGITARAIGRVIDAVIGSIKHMWAWFTNLGTVIKAAIPESLVEKWKKLTDAVKRFFGLGDGQNKALTKLGEVTAKVSAKFDAFQEKIKGKVQPVLDKITAKVSNLATRGFAKLDGVMDKVLAKFQAFKAKFQEKWGDVSAATADKLKTKLSELREKASMTWADKGAPKLAVLRQRMHELAEEGRATWAEQALPKIQRFKTALANAFSTLLHGGGVKAALSELKAAFKDLFDIDLSGIKSKLGGVIEPFKIKDTDLGGKIIPKIKEGFAQVKAYIEAKDWKGLGRYIVESFSKGSRRPPTGSGTSSSRWSRSSRPRPRRFRPLPARSARARSSRVSSRSAPRPRTPWSRSRRRCRRSTASSTSGRCSRRRSVSAPAWAYSRPGRVCSTARSPRHCRRSTRRSRTSPRRSSRSPTR